MADHVHIAGSCTHCGIGELDAMLYGPEKCPVTGPERKTSWSFGPDARDEVEG